MVINYVFKDPTPNIEWFYFVNFMGYFLIFFCGCLAGYLVHKKIVLHAALATTLGVAFSIFLMGVKLTDYMTFFSILVLGAVLGGLGGCVVLIIKKLCGNKIPSV